PAPPRNRDPAESQCDVQVTQSAESGRGHESCVGILPLFPDGPEFSVDWQQLRARREPECQSALEWHSHVCPQWMPPGSFSGDPGKFTIHFGRDVQVLAIVIVLEEFRDSCLFLR